jgi:arginase
MSDVILLPYHQDERLDDEAIVVPSGVEATLVDPPLPAADTQWPRLVALYEVLAEAVAVGVRGDRLRAVVVGDCLASLGTLAGLQRAGHDPSIVWFDAHGDIHTWASSTSKYLGGMPLRMMIGGDPDRLTGPLGIRALTEDRAVLVDARDLDPGEVDFLATSQVRRSSVEALSADDLPPGPVLVHIDLDVIDASEVPGMRFPVANGPSSDAVLAAVARLYASGRVVLLSLSCPWYRTDDAARARQRTALIDRFLAVARRADSAPSSIPAASVPSTTA